MLLLLAVVAEKRFGAYKESHDDEEDDAALIDGIQLIPDLGCQRLLYF